MINLLFKLTWTIIGIVIITFGLITIILMIWDKIKEKIIKKITEDNSASIGNLYNRIEELEKEINKLKNKR
jgi:ABC-type bacteriocin/lantibiotic exporter with double-glycine peptidase domain